MNDTLRYQGDDIDIEFPPVVDADGDVVDITGASIYCAARLVGSSTAVPADVFVLDNPTAGLCHVRFRRATTAGFAAGTYTYDARLKLGDGSVHAIGFGTFTIRVPITVVP